VRVVIALEVILLVIGVGAVAAAYGAYKSILPIVPEAEDIGDYQPAATTILYAANGEEIARVFDDEDRILVDLKDVPELVQEATIAIEDKRFHDHKGFDPIRLVKVTQLEMTEGGQTQGGSTITMQLAREIYLSKRKSFGRKIQELALAIEIERKFSKDQILEMYLNQVCYGDRTYGIKAAAGRFFHKDLSELELHEAALLAALPNNPEGRSPYNFPEAAKQRRDLVLDVMAEEHYVTRQEAEKAKDKPLGVKERAPRGLLSYRAPYFTQHAILELTDRYGHDAVYGGGLRVYTTLDLEVQARAQEIVRRGVERSSGRRVRQGAAVIMEPTTGHILAIVGGKQWSEEDQYNRATLAERQPGSSMKPYVWTTAMEVLGMGPGSPVSGAPASFNVGGGLYWSPNPGGSGGMYTLASALKASVNIVSARLALTAGPEAVVRTAKKMGIRSNIRPFPSIALGSEGVTVLDQATAYSCFANGGYRPTATCLAKVLDHNGIVIDRCDPELEQVLDQRVAYDMNNMMQGVIQGGTGRAGRGLPAPAGGKTGTTDRSCDAWFVGFTPKLTTAVWVGNDENDPMYGVYGGNVPCPIWKELMEMTMEVTGKEGGEFPGPGHSLPRRPQKHVALVQGSPAPDKEESSESTGGGGGGRGAPRELFY
jgi:penicillin-binding protein 1A